MAVRVITCRACEFSMKAVYGWLSWWQCPVCGVHNGVSGDMDTLDEKRVTAQPVTVDGERRVQVSVGLVWAVLTLDEARGLVKQIELAETGI